MNILKLLANPRWEKLIELARPRQDSREDKGHGDTVVSWAAVLLDEVCDSGLLVPLPDRELVLIAALLHDVGWSRLSRADRKRLFAPDLGSEEERALRLAHEKEGAALALELIPAAGFSEELAARAAELIDGHDTRTAEISTEDGILRDADRLWMVTNRGFRADLERRKLSATSWAGTLRKRFMGKEAFFLAASRERALRRLERLEQGRRVPEPGDDERPRVMICHYRVGWTDGVSLEIEKRQEVLEEMGFRVALLGGPGSAGADYVIPELDFDTPEARKISRNAFGSIEDFPSSRELGAAILDLAEQVEEKVQAAVSDWDPDFILLHNIFSHGRHIAAARAFARCLVRLNRPALTTHHDFYWEREDFKTPSCSWVEEFLNDYVPPVIPGMRHAVINSLAARHLLNRKGIDAMIFPDTLDFSVDPWVKDDYNRHLPKDFDLNPDDIFILQATRIVRRKGIELIPPVIERLNTPEYLNLLAGKRLYNGKKVTPSSRFVFLLAGYAELEAEPYREELVGQMERLGVPFRFLRSRIAVEREDAGGAGKIYSLFDTYPYADLVSYPSVYEGWGNQFIEAVFARRPVMVYEYPVFKSDIRPKGYRVINMGDSASFGDDRLHHLPEDEISRICGEVVEWLLSSETPRRLDTNFELARNNNSYDYLRELMRRSMEHCEDCGDF